MTIHSYPAIWEYDMQASLTQIVRVPLEKLVPPTQGGGDDAA